MLIPNRILVHVNAAGIDPRLPGLVWDSRTRPFDDLDLWVILKGTAVLDTPAGRRDVHAGDFFLLRPGERYIMKCDARRPAVAAWVHYDYVMEDRVDGLTSASPAEPPTHAARCAIAPRAWQVPKGSLRGHAPYHSLPPLSGRVRDIAFVESLFRRMVEAWQRGEANGRDADAWLAALLVEITGREGPVGEEGLAQRLRHLCQEIRQRPGRVYTVAELARRFSLSPDHFTRVFRRTVGQSPMEFMIRVRVDAAKRLLRQTDASISHIADSLGYTDVYFFSKQFRVKTGQCPSEYRKAR